MKKLIALLGFALSPLSTFAQTTGGSLNNINNVTDRFTQLGNTFVTILISVAIIWIIFSVVRYLIIGSGDPEKRKTAGMSILWGVVGVFVILSVWGLVNILKNSFTTNTAAPNVQDINRLNIQNIPPVSI